MDTTQFCQHIIDNYDNFCQVAQLVKTLDNNYFTTTIINGKILDNDTVSIVMTACNRSVQTYFTIETISKSSHQNVQVILVDDSTTDFVLESELEKYNVHIELIHIKNKFWINPCVNYNIAFSHVKGGKIIIQNAEVCHVGDVVNYVATKVEDNEYHCFNVFSLRNQIVNNMLYAIKEMTQENKPEILNLVHKWYQHPVHRNAHLHFLTAITTHTFSKINGFDNDYAMAVDFDDNNLILRIRNNLIQIIDVADTFMGIHQWHSRTSAGSQSGNPSNEYIHRFKAHYASTYRKRLNFTEHTKEELSKIVCNNIIQI